MTVQLQLSGISRLSVQRLRTLQQKKEAQAKSSRRDIASLLERGKVETARVKVENSMLFLSWLFYVLKLTFFSYQRGHLCRTA